MVSPMEHLVLRGMGVASVEAEGGKLEEEGHWVDAQRCHGAEELWEAGRPVGKSLPRLRHRGVGGPRMRTVS